jgi:ATP-dependent RNA helicase SUPV3L1/SUV3
LRDLEAAIQSGKIKGLARGIAYQLAESGGVLDRSLVEAEVRALSPVERRHLRAIGVRFGAFSLFLPALLTPEALAFTRAFAAIERPDWPAAFQSIGPLPSAIPSARILAAYGLRAVGAFTVPVLMLEQLDNHLRALPAVNGAMPLTSEAIEALGWTPSQAEWVLRGLNFAPVGKPVPGEPRLWRRRRADRAQAAKAPEQTAKAQAAIDRAVAASPFAALAALKVPPPAPAKPARRRRRPVRKIANAQKGQAG